MTVLAKQSITPEMRLPSLYLSLKYLPKMLRSEFSQHHGDLGKYWVFLQRNWSFLKWSSNQNYQKGDHMISFRVHIVHYVKGKVLSLHILAVDCVRIVCSTACFSLCLNIYFRFTFGVGNTKVCLY